MGQRALPYFWDYKLKKDEVKKILTSGGEKERYWVLARILESAPLPEVWDYITLQELQKVFPHLKLKEPVRRVWEKALAVWGKS